ncbi:hypothetical protein ACLMJK_000950 [Lecanora helva]
MEAQSSSSEAIVPKDNFYDQLGLQYEKAFSHNPGYHRVIQSFLELVPNDGHIFDCGCGTGKPVAHMIAESGRRVSGIDFSKTMVELSSQQVQTGSFEQANMLDYTPVDALDGVVAAFSLFELTREEITLMSHKWFEWLRPGGFLLIGTIGAEDCDTPPESYDPDGQFARDVQFTFMDQRVSMGLFTRAGWVAMLNEVGFKIIRTEIELFVPPSSDVCDDELQYFVTVQKVSDA